MQHRPFIGDHWVVLHVAAEGEEYFESLGGAISHDEFVQFVGSTDACPFRLRNYFLAFVVNIVYFTCLLDVIQCMI